MSKLTASQKRARKLKDNRTRSNKSLKLARDTRGAPVEVNWQGMDFPVRGDASVKGILQGHANTLDVPKRYLKGKSSGKKWTGDEERALLDRVITGSSLISTCKFHGRSPYALLARLDILVRSGAYGAYKDSLQPKVKTEPKVKIKPKVKTEPKIDPEGREAKLRELKGPDQGQKLDNTEDKVNLWSWSLAITTLGLVAYFAYTTFK